MYDSQCNHASRRPPPAHQDAHEHRFDGGHSLRDRNAQRKERAADDKALPPLLSRTRQHYDSPIMLQKPRSVHLGPPKK